MAARRLLAVAMTALVAACSAGGGREVEAPRLASSVTAAWPQVSRDAAQAMIAKYGQPDEVTETMLVWHDPGPWKHTILSRDPTPHDFPKAHTDVLEQVID